MPKRPSGAPASRCRWGWNDRRWRGLALARLDRLDDAQGAGVALTAGAAAVALVALPYKTGLFIAALAGLVAGAAMPRERK